MTALADLDFPAVLECADPQHATAHRPLQTAAWLVQIRACGRTHRPPTPDCMPRTMLLCESGLATLMRMETIEHTPGCGFRAAPDWWVVTRKPVATRPGFDLYRCPEDGGTYACQAGARWPVLRTHWINHHSTHLENP